MPRWMLRVFMVWLGLASLCTAMSAEDKPMMEQLAAQLASDKDEDVSAAIDWLTRHRKKMYFPLFLEAAKRGKLDSLVKETLYFTRHTFGRKSHEKCLELVRASNTIILGCRIAAFSDRGPIIAERHLFDPRRTFPAIYAEIVERVIESDSLSSAELEEFINASNARGVESKKEFYSDFKKIFLKENPKLRSLALSVLIERPNQHSDFLSAHAGLISQTDRLVLAAKALLKFCRKAGRIDDPFIEMDYWGEPPKVTDEMRTTAKQQMSDLLQFLKTVASAKQMEGDGESVTPLPTMCSTAQQAVLTYARYQWDDVDEALDVQEVVGDSMEALLAKSDKEDVGDYLGGFSYYFKLPDPLGRKMLRLLADKYSDDLVVLLLDKRWGFGGRGDQILLDVVHCDRVSLEIRLTALKNVLSHLSDTALDNLLAPGAPETTLVILRAKGKSMGIDSERLLEALKSKNADIRLAAREALQARLRVSLGTIGEKAVPSQADMAAIRNLLVQTHLLQESD